MKLQRIGGRHQATQVDALDHARERLLQVRGRGSAQRLPVELSGFGNSASAGMPMRPLNMVTCGVRGRMAEAIPTPGSVNAAGQRMAA